MSDVVDGIEDLAQRKDDVSIRDVIGEFGDRSFAPFMLILSLIGMTPVGGIPGVPSFIALSIALVAGQLALGRSHIWLPALIADRSTGTKKLRKGKDKLDTLATLLDRLAQGRLATFARGPAIRVAAGVIIALCCSVPMLELLPFAAAIPFLSIAVLSLAMIVRDGLVMLLGGLIAAAAMAGGLYWTLG